MKNYFIIIFLVVSFLMLLCCARNNQENIQSKSLNQQMIGMTENPTATAFSKPPQEMTMNEIQALYVDMQANTLKAASIGLNSLALGVSWDEMEPSPGVYNFSSLQDTITRSKLANRSLELFNVRVIDTTDKPLPTDLLNLPMDSEETKQRAKELFQALAPVLTDGNVKRVEFGNEIDIYFLYHPEEAMNFAWLFWLTKQEFKKIMPNVPFGMSVTFEQIKKPEIQAALKPIIQLGDFVAFTYYPINERFVVRNPYTAISDIKTMRKIAEGFGFSEAILQEVGYPSSRTCRSSERMQKNFYKYALREIKANADFFPFACFFIMCDYPQWFVDQFGGYYGIDDKAFLEYLKTVGTIDENGNPKDSWNFLKKNL